MSWGPGLSEGGQLRILVEEMGSMSPEEQVGISHGKMKQKVWGKGFQGRGRGMCRRLEGKRKLGALKNRLCPCAYLVYP